MTPERWQKVDEIFQAAIELNADERAAFLDNSCAGDEELRYEVESLISSDEQGLSFIDEPAFQRAAGLLVNAQPELSEGERIGHYKIVGLLGTGGMGEVYLAEDTELGRKVALKLLPAEFTRDKERVQRFRQEARLASSLNHPNILIVHQIGQIEGHHFIATEFVDGETLRQRLSRSSVDAGQALDIAIQTASALSAAHEAGIVHRDIKPENIMIRRDRFVKVLDFGLAKLTEQPSMADDGKAPTGGKVDTTPGLVMGTIKYMSPEQARGLVVDARTDIFSLGIVLYEMVAGHAPFAGETISDLLASILKDEPPPITEYRPDTPEELTRIICNLLSKDKEKRYQTADDLIVDLKSLKADLEFAPKNQSPVQTAKNNHQVSKSTLWAKAASTSTRAITSTQPETRLTPSTTRHLTSGISQHKGLAALVLVALAIVASALAYFHWKTPAVPKVNGSVRITNDGLLKQERCCDRIHPSMVSDGSRLIFAQAVSGRPHAVYQVSENGGETVELPVGLQNVHILDISPNRSELLVSTPSAFEEEAPLWIVPLIGGAPRRLGDLVGHAATYSPDGKQIVYANDFDLYSATTEGGGARKIATLDGRAEWLRWSPDGNRLRFTLIDTQSDRSPSLWEMMADGSKLHPLLPGWNNPSAECCGNWISDGRYYLFQSTRDKVSNIWAIREEPDESQKVKHEPVQLTFGPVDFYAPVPSRDGTKMFVTSEQRRGELVRYDWKTGQYVKFLSGISADCLDFSRDGQWVTYTTFPDESLWRSRVDGSERLQLSFPPMRAFRPRWSPDATKIVFTDLESGKPRKSYIVSADGGKPAQATTDNRSELDVGWTPDGNSLVFSAGEKLESFAIYLFDLRTRQLSMLPGSEGMFSSQMSPDGRYVSAKTVDFKKFVVFDIAKQNWFELPIQQNAGWQNWSRDGKYLYFGGIDKAAAWVLFRAHVGDWRIEQLAELKDIQFASGAFGAWLGWTPDDSALMLRDVGIQDVYAMDLNLP
jgi:serine/threonine protein kinase/Tol biopolymer transport system component